MILFAVSTILTHITASMISFIKIRIETLFLFILEESRTFIGFQLLLYRLSKFARRKWSLRTIMTVTGIQRFAVIEIFILIIASYIAISFRLVRLISTIPSGIGAEEEFPCLFFPLAPRPTPGLS